jgi:hypothetical protein
LDVLVGVWVEGDAIDLEDRGLLVFFDFFLVDRGMIFDLDPGVCGYLYGLIGVVDLQVKDLDIAICEGGSFRVCELGCHHQHQGFLHGMGFFSFFDPDFQFPSPAFDLYFSGDDASLSQQVDGLVCDAAGLDGVIKADLYLSILDLALEYLECSYFWLKCLGMKVVSIKRQNNDDAENKDGDDSFSQIGHIELLNIISLIV